MAHIHTNRGEHDLTASAFIVRTDFPEPRLLLHMHKKLGVLLQPGGHVELEETPWQAIEHELREESGYTFDELKVLQPANRLKSISNATLHPVPVVFNTHNFDTEGAHRHTDASFAFVADAAPSLLPEEGESSDLRWLSGQELDKLSANEIFDNVREIGQYVLNIVYEEWERVDPAEYAL